MTRSRDGSAGVATLTSQMPVSYALASEEPAVVPAFDEVYERHVAFVWRVARAFGLTGAQLEDAVQEVFLVVHRRLPEFEGRSAITTWLFAITRRVALAARRRDVRNEPLEAEPAGDASADPFAQVTRAEAAAIVGKILDGMDEDQRLVFVLVEIEQLSVPEVARMLELKLNTAYSRLRLARAAFTAAVQPWRHA